MFKDIPQHKVEVAVPRSTGDLHSYRGRKGQEAEVGGWAVEEAGLVGEVVEVVRVVAAMVEEEADWLVAETVEVMGAEAD